MTGREFLTSEEITATRLQTIGKICNNSCEGSGAILSNGTFLDCSCVKEFHRRISYLSSGIPKKYWEFTPEDLLEKFVSANKIPLEIVYRYISQIPEMVSQGIGMFIQGKSGLAKSALGYYILKEALKHNVECFAIRMSELTHLIFDSLKNEESRDKLRWIRLDVGLLLIDEIDKDYKISDSSTFSGTQVNEFFGDIYNQQKSVLVTSNLSKKDLSRVHALNVVDRLSELVDIVFVGESYRKPEAALCKILGEDNGDS